MKKSILFVILAVMLLCGCNNRAESDAGTSVINTGSPLSMQEYYDTVMSCYFEYVSGTSLGSTPEAARATVEPRVSALEKFDKIVPPAEYSKRHKEMMNAAEKEREWNKVLSNFANGVIGYEDLNSECVRIYGSTRVESEFTTKVLEMVAALNKEPGITVSEDGKKLEQLYELFK